MQDLDSFILTIPGFDGEIPIPAIPILACDPRAESFEDPSARSSASASRTRACKRKAPLDPNPPKKAKKIVGKPLGRIKITGPKQKAPASSPPSETRKGIWVLRSRRSTYHKYFLLPFIVNPQTSRQSVSRYYFGLSCKEYFTRD
jgi:hypothetical protein